MPRSPKPPAPAPGSAPGSAPGGDPGVAAAAKPPPRLLVCAEDVQIESRSFKAGAVVGEIRDGRIVPTAPGVAFGHIEARIGQGLIVEGNPADFTRRGHQAAPPPRPRKRQPNPRPTAPPPLPDPLQPTTHPLIHKVNRTRRTPS